MWRWWPIFEKSGQRVRFYVASLVFLMALFSVLFTMIPWPIGGTSAAPVVMGPRPRPVQSAWDIVDKIIDPHITLKHPEGGPAL